MNRLPDDQPRTAALPRQRGPLGALLALFSSIWLGVGLLTALFVYSSIGSAGWFWPTAWCSDVDSFWRTDNVMMAGLSQVHVRQMPGLEMSEFEWFHWWPFDLIIALICTNLVVATLRRIPFKPINYGVWMIHTGIIVLALGSVYYFTTKREGDTPVVRRTLVAELPGHEPVSVLALPGNTLSIGSGDDRYDLSVASIDPAWELLSGDDEGKHAYKISVSVSRGSERFIRELLANFPQYTEDLVRSGDPNQPIARAKKTLGKPLVDERLSLSLAPAPQTHFYLVGTSAIYLRPEGATAWSGRPIDGLPRYNDYIAGPDDVWPGAGMPTELRPLSIDVQPDARSGDAAAPDPLTDHPIRVDRYLRYAVPQPRRIPGGDRLDPTAWLSIESTMSRAPIEQELVAGHPAHETALEGRVRLQWADSPAAVEALRARLLATLEITVPGQTPITAPITETTLLNEDAAFRPVPGTTFEYRVIRNDDGLVITANNVVSLAVVEVRSPEKSFVRWVFEDAAKTRDFAPGTGDEVQGDPIPLDESFTLAYRPGLAEATLVAGPADDDLTLLMVSPEGEPTARPMAPGDRLQLRDGTMVTIDRYAARTRRETRPAIVPFAQRSGDADVYYSLVHVELPADAVADGEPTSFWLPYHHYVFESEQEKLLRYRYEPTTFTAADGRRMQIIYGRDREELSAPVVLEDFHLVEHVGGYTGSNLSIRDWVSDVQFEDGPSGLTPMQEVRVNGPIEHDGWWYFQAQWDPPIPDRGYAGLNYTVLGVGNRNGVIIQLVGCCIAVLGMIYAFYVKPIIRRRRQQAVYQAVATRGAGMEVEPPAAAAAGDPEPVTAGGENSR